ncbi:MAG: tyrosine-type recombinase/integrase [Nevskia sp.]
MLTDKKLESLKPKAKPYLATDGDGLAIQVHPGGGKTWLYRYRLNGRQHAVRLGSYPAVSGKMARTRRLDAARMVAEGKSPAVEKRVAKDALSARSTVEEFAQLYLDQVVTRDRKDSKQIERYLRREILPTLAKLPVVEITPHHIMAITDRMKRRGVPMAALQVRNLLKRMFDYAIARQLMSFNPAAAIPAKAVAVTKSRDRSLSPDEIRTYLTKLYASDVGRRYKLALHLILLTLVRKSELVLARWDEIDLEAGEWIIPAANNKTRKGKIIYLSEQARALLSELRSVAGDREHVIPGRNKPGQPVSKTALNAALLAVDFGIEHFTIHDSRRTASTLLNEMGWNSDVIEKALGHEIGGVRGIYNRAEYAEQRRQMLQQWADYVDARMNGGKVIAGNFGRAA